MTRALRDALHAAAHDEGCSLNAYALQILAAAAGDPARFRGGAPSEPVDDVRDLERDERGFPILRKQRSIHIDARSAFLDAMMAEHGAAEAVRRAGVHDVEDPAFFVEWKRRRDESGQSENAAAGSA